MGLAISTRMEGEKKGTKNTNKLLVQGIRFTDKTKWEEKTVNEVDVKQWRERPTCFHSHYKAHWKYGKKNL